MEGSAIASVGQQVVAWSVEHGAWGLERIVYLCGRPGKPENGERKTETGKRENAWKEGVMVRLGEGV